jgi:hypothetical protein
MAFRVGVLIALCAGCAVTNPQLAAAQGSSSDEVQPLRFVIAAEPPSYRVDEIETTQYPSSKEAVFSVTGEILNISKHDRFFYHFEATGTPTCHLTGPDGKPIEIAYRISDPALPTKESFVLIKAGQSLQKHFDVSFWTGDAVAPGTYTLSMDYRVWMDWYMNVDGDKVERVDVDAWTGTLHSNEVTIDVH